VRSGRSVATPAEPAPDRTPRRDQVGLAVGDRVVYASHGIGSIVMTSGPEALSPSILIAFESGMRITLPLERAREALRPLSSVAELDGVGRTLRSDAPLTTEPWSRRSRSIREKVTDGGVIGLAEVVRDGLRREQGDGRGGAGRLAGPTEGGLYRQARALLAAEIAACREVELEDADGWIVQQVCGGPDGRASRPQAFEPEGESSRSGRPPGVKLRRSQTR